MLVYCFFFAVLSSRTIQTPKKIAVDATIWVTLTQKTEEAKETQETKKKDQKKTADLDDS